jgi:hypothetical protein
VDLGAASQLTKHPRERAAEKVGRPQPKREEQRKPELKSLEVSPARGNQLRKELRESADMVT